MLLPSGRFSLLDDTFFDNPRRESMMNTDIIERDNEYELKVDLPGFNKEDIKIELENGHLKIHAKNVKNDEEKQDGRVIRQERYYGEFTRSFYMGDNLENDDISASFDKGVLTVVVPKKEEVKETKKYIDIK